MPSQIPILVNFGFEKDGSQPQLGVGEEGSF